ncbi:MAG TPA: hypothetical protein VG166_02555 [Caulobacteraceae bacterium]|jgi:hypothetical protein|nr:hypothetical protein [Caulobacteraceae bacterium]
MSTITWAADADGDFASNANWNGGKAPGATDTADLFTPGYAYFTVTSAANAAVGSLFVSNYATLDLTAGAFGVANGVTVEGAVTVAGGATLAVGGAIANGGEIDLTSVTASKSSLLVINGSAVSLTGVGVVSLAKYGEIIGAVTSDQLFNVSTISGGGLISGVALVNRAGGVIDGTADMRIDTSGQILDNAGLIEATGGGFGMRIGYTTIFNQGGTIAGNGGTLVLASTVVEGGTLATSGGGLIESSGAGVVLDGVLGLTNAGAFQFQGTLGMEGLITNSGVISENTATASEIMLVQNLTLGGHGTVAFDGAGLNSIYSAPGHTLTNNGTIFGGVAIGNGKMGIINTATGVIDAQGAGAQIRLQSAYTVVNAGRMEAQGGGTFTFDDATVNNSGGTIFAGAGSGVDLLGQAISGGAVSIAATGTLFVSGGGTIDLSGGGSVTNAGLMFFDGGSSLFKGGTIHNAGGALTAAGASITLEAITLLGGGALADTLTTEGASTIAIDNGSSVQIQGSSSNSGVIAIAAGAAFTDLRILSGGATLSGAGTVSLSGSKARILGISAASTLTNVDNTIVGTGAIGADIMTLVNDAAGTIEATGRLAVRDAAGKTLTNAGLMEAVSGGTLILTTETIAQNGGGTILAAGGVVDLDGVDLIGGTLSSTGTGHISVGAGANIVDGGVSKVTLGGLLRVASARTLTVGGTVTSTGKIDLLAGKLIVAAAGVTLSGKGQVNLNDNAGNIVVGATTTATLTNIDERIAGAGHLGDGAMALVNEAGGQIIGNQTLALILDTGARTIANAGLIENTGKGGTMIMSAVNNTGTLMAGAAGTLTLAGTVTGAGVGRINGGTLYAKNKFTQNVTFAGTTGVLELGVATAYTGAVSGLSKTGTDWLDLADIAFTSGVTKATYSGTTASGTLTVTDGTHTAHIKLMGNYTASTFTVSSDGHGGTKVVDPAAASTPSAAPLAQAMAGLVAGPAPVSQHPSSSEALMPSLFGVAPS